jgi:hypothetical protein
MENDSERIWKNQRYYLILENIQNGVFPPPFNFLNLFSILLSYIIKILDKISSSKIHIQDVHDKDLYCKKNLI